MRVGVGSPNMSGNNFTVAVDLAQNTSKPGGINWINDTTYSLNVSNLSGTYQVFAYWDYNQLCQMQLEYENKQLVLAMANMIGGVAND